MIVPVSNLSLLTCEALNAAASLGDEVHAVTVCHPDAEDRSQTATLERDWAQWNPGVPLVRLASEHRALGRPIAAYVRGIAGPGTRVTVLIPEVEPDRLGQRLLRNQRGAVVAHAVRRGTDAVICRLRFRISWPLRPNGPHLTGVGRRRCPGGAGPATVGESGVWVPSRADGPPYGRRQRPPNPADEALSSNRPFDPTLI